MLPDQWSIQQGAGGTDPETDKDRLQSGQLQPRYLSFSKSSNCVLFLTAIHVKSISVFAFMSGKQTLGFNDPLQAETDYLLSLVLLHASYLCPLLFFNFFSFLFLGNTACLSL